MKLVKYTLSEETETDSYSEGITYHSIDDVELAAKNWESIYNSHSTLYITTITGEVSKSKALYFLANDLEEDEIFDLLIEEDWEVIADDVTYDSEPFEEFERKNHESDNLLNEVLEMLSIEIGTKVGKYTSLYIDANGNLNAEEGEQVTIRIADHTHNPARSNDLTVVIADHDATKERYFCAKTDLAFTSSDRAEEIVNEIKNFFSK